MLQLVHNVTLLDANGRMWPDAPRLGTDGLVTVIQTPSSHVSALVRNLAFSHATLDARAQLLAAITSKGDVYIFHLRQNRYTRLDKTGHAATSAVFSSTGTLRQLFVGFTDSSIRCYDVVKGVQTGILREHRCPPCHLAVRTGCHEMLSVAPDGIILWDTQALQRKRALGNGPYGALHASYTPDGMNMVAAFQDGSLHVWNLRSFSLLRSFPPLPAGAPGPSLSRLQRSFCLSPDGLLLVSCGPALPLLLVHSALTAALLHAVRLPTYPEEVQGVERAEFLPDSTVVAALCRDGAIRFIDVKAGKVVCEIPRSQDMQLTGCSFSMDTRGNQLALLTDGKVLLYDLAGVRKQAAGTVPLALHLVEPSRLEEVAAALPLRVLGAAAGAGEGEGGEGGAAAPAFRGEGEALGGEGTGRQEEGTGGGAPAARGTAARPVGMPKGRAGGVKRGPTRKQAAGGRGAAGGGVEQRLGSGGALELSLPRLQAMLQAFGEYPARYRLIIWDRLLQLPHNSQAHAALVNQGLHPCCQAQGLQETLQAMGRPLVHRMTQAMSQLAHWCPVFAEAGFVPHMVFPWVKLFTSSPSAPLAPECCFELLATLMCNWAKGWFDRFPHPPVGVLVRMQDLLQFHDPALASHLNTVAAPDTYASLAWPLLRTLLSDALPAGAWLRAWDHCFSSGPDLLYCLATSYFTAGVRSQLLALGTRRDVLELLAGAPAVDVGLLLRAAYAMRDATPKELLPAGGAGLEALPHAVVYGEYRHYPVGAVQLFSQERIKAAEAEEALARRRKVVAELELRGKTTALQAAGLEQERAALAAAQEERREQLRRTEAAMAAQLARLDDRAKEEKLKQVLHIESAYQRNLLQMRQEWQRELVQLRLEVQHKQQLMAYQTKSKEEEEALNVLEFQSKQRMWELEQEAVRTAMQAALRDEVDGRMAELQAVQARRGREWEAEERQRAVRLAQEGARQAELVRRAEEAAAQGALRRELLATTLSLEDQLIKAGAERRLRHLAEDQSLLTSQASRVERQQQEVRAAADESALRAQAQGDLMWYEAEQRRRESVVEAEKAALQAAMERSRRELADAEAQVQQVNSQTALLERRRTLELQNLAEDVEARRALEALALERSRGLQLSFELRRREEEAAAQLEMARAATGLEMQGLRRGVEGEEGEGMEGVREQLARALQEEEAAARERLARGMAELGKEREAKLADLEAQLRRGAAPGPSPGVDAAPGGQQGQQQQQQQQQQQPGGLQGPAAQDPTRPSELDVLRAVEKMRSEMEQKQQQPRRPAAQESGSEDSYSSSSSSGNNSSSSSSSSESGGRRGAGGGLGAMRLEPAGGDSLAQPFGRGAGGILGTQSGGAGGAGARWRGGSEGQSGASGASGASGLAPGVSGVAGALVGGGGWRGGDGAGGEGRGGRVGVLEPGALADLVEQQLSSGTGGTTTSGSGGQRRDQGAESKRTGGRDTAGAGGGRVGPGLGLGAGPQPSRSFSPLSMVSGSGSTTSPGLGAGAGIVGGTLSAVPGLGRAPAAAPRPEAGEQHQRLPAGTTSAQGLPGSWVTPAAPAFRGGSQSPDAAALGPNSSARQGPGLQPASLGRALATPLSEVSSPGDVDALISRLRLNLGVGSSIDSALTSDADASEVSSLAYASSTAQGSRQEGGGLTPPQS